MTACAEQIPFDLPHRPAYGREDFLVGTANEDAVHWLDRWPEWPAPVLVIQGPPASGKSHLAAVWKDRTKAALIPPEDLQKAGADNCAAKAEHLVLDGLDLWIGDIKTETQIFHLY